MKTTTKKIIEQIKTNCLNANVDFKVDKSLTINQFRKYLIIAKANNIIILYYSPKGFNKLYDEAEKIKKFNEIELTDMFVGA